MLSAKRDAHHNVRSALGGLSEGRVVMTSSFT